jgi:hypothetical protein
MKWDIRTQSSYILRYQVNIYLEQLGNNAGNISEIAGFGSECHNLVSMKMLEERNKI